MICLSLFYAINWLREILNCCKKIEKRDRPSFNKRLENLIGLEQKLDNCLKNHNFSIPLENLMLKAGGEVIETTDPLVNEKKKDTNGKKNSSSHKNSEKMSKKGNRKSKKKPGEEEKEDQENEHAEEERYEEEEEEEEEDEEVKTGVDDSKSKARTKAKSELDAIALTQVEKLRPYMRELQVSLK